MKEEDSILSREEKKMTKSNKDNKKIGFQGVSGCNSEVAAERYDPDMTRVPFNTFSELFSAEEDERIDRGMVPIENSLEGSVKELNKLLMNSELKIVGEYNLPISYSLLAVEEKSLEDIDKVYSHPQALGQCSEFISKNRLESEAFFDTAGAAKMVSEKREDDHAAIARKECAEIYGLKILADEIEDTDKNITRCLVIGRNESVHGDKVSIAFSTEHEPGSLNKVLKIFAEREINLTRIESIPTRKTPWTYYFYLDFMCPQDHERVLERVEEEVLWLKRFGCYEEHE